MDCHLLARSVGVGDGEDEAVLLAVGFRIPGGQVIGTIVDSKRHRSNGDALLRWLALGGATEDKGALMESVRLGLPVRPARTLSPLGSDSRGALVQVFGKQVCCSGKECLPVIVKPDDVEHVIWALGIGHDDSLGCGIGEALLQYGGGGWKLGVEREVGLVDRHFVNIVDAGTDGTAFRRIGRAVDGSPIARGLHEGSELCNYMAA